MSSSGPGRFTVEELLGHADWLQRLAGQLARGEADAADALQDTWTAALRSPPDRDRPAQPWLAEVLRNVLKRAARAASSRRGREESFEALSRPTVPTPEALLERAEAQRRLAALVVALEEPFRSTVLLRYFEGRSAAEIARGQGVPPGTVRWRLKEGLDRLRQRLDGDDSDGPRSWLALLAPLPASAPPPSLLPVGLGLGGLLWAMSATQKIAAGVLLGLVLLGGAGFLFQRRSPPPSSPSPVASDEDQRSRSRPPAFVSALSLPSGEVTADDSAAGSVEGQVVSSADGTGVAGAEVGFSFAGASLATVTDAQGRFRFVPTEAGAYQLARVSAPDFFAFSPEWGDSPIAFSLRAGERIRGVRLALRPLRVCRGRLVDEGGQPVAGARLSAGMLVGPISVAGLSESTAADGTFEYPARETLTIEAHHQDRIAREHVGLAGVQQCRLRLQLKSYPPVRPRNITGQVVAADGRPAAGIAVDAWTIPTFAPDARHLSARAETGSDGRFTLGPLDAPTYIVSARLAGRLAVEREEVPSDTRDLVLRLPATGRLRGLVVSADDGRPVVSFSVAVFRHRPPAEALWGVFTRHDGRGAFEIEGVPEGTYQVTVVAEGRTPVEERAVPVKADPAPPPETRFVLREGNRVFGVVTDRQTRAPIAGAQVTLEGRAGVASELPLRAEILTREDGSFELRGLPSGRLSLLVSAPGHHGRIIGGLDIKAERDLGPVAVDLSPTREGEKPRIELVGIGAALARQGDTLVFGALSPEGGAARAGLVPGDVILAIDGRTVKELGGLEGAVQRIRGAEGTVVLFRIRRGVDGVAKEVAVTRALVKGP